LVASKFKGENMWYEVQKYGVTLEIDKSYKKAESAFLTASPGGVVLMKLDSGTQTKSVIKSR
jgi:hypothetical protein